MEWIKKNKEKDANKLIEEFLEHAQKNGSTDKSIYSNDFCNKNFVNDKNSSYKDIILKLVLLPEQNNKCCYCMREISKSSTIEHIIPQKIDNKVDLDKYFQNKAKNLNSDNICITRDYINNKFPQTPPYPHKIAYHNITATCNQCNNNRSDKIIEPLFLYEGIDKEVIYNEYTGEMQWENDPFYKSNEFNDPCELDKPTVEKIGLNNLELKIIRAICFYLKRNNKSIEEISTGKEREYILYNILGKMLEANVDISDISKFSNMTTAFGWNKLKDYNYFLK